MAAPARARSPAQDTAPAAASTEDAAPRRRRAQRSPDARDAPADTPPAAHDAAAIWPADRVERWPLSRLKPYERNSRTHRPAQIDKIAASMKQFGFAVPILAAADGTIIAGHARYAAAQKLGWTEAPVMTAGGWTKNQIRAYVIADNRLASEAGWDRNMLAEEFKGLQLEGFDVLLSGFSKDDIARISGTFFSTAAVLGTGLSYQVIVEATSEQHQAELIGRFRAEGLTCKPLIL